MRRGIWVYLEHEGETFESVSLELLGKARTLADAAGEPLTGLILGSGIGALAQETAKYGVDEVISVQHPLLKPYTTDAYVQAAHRALTEGQPNILLLGATPNGRDLAGRLAVKLRTGLTADCTNLDVKFTDRGTLLLSSEVTGFGGGVVAIITCKRQRPQMATVRPGVFLLPAPGKPSRHVKFRTIPVTIHPESIRTKVLKRQRGAEGDLTRAGRLVIGGRGVRGDFQLLEQLAQTIDADLGATRVAVDAGWITKEAMVGQTGYVTHPKVAIVCGVSGAFQFMVGIQDADCIIAINNDPAAPIFEQADYCVAEDLFQILPPLIEEVNKL